MPLAAVVVVSHSIAVAVATRPRRVWYHVIQSPPSAFLLDFLDDDSYHLQTTSSSLPRPSRVVLAALLFPSSRVLHSRPSFFVSLSTDPDFCAGSVALFASCFPPRDLFMQSEPTAVSQRSSAEPTPEESLKSTQHGNDFCGDDRQVYDSLRRGEVVPGAAQDGGGSPLNEAAPSSTPVSRNTEFGYKSHMASSLASSLDVEPSFSLVASSGRNTVSFEDFPNGTLRGVSRLSALRYRSSSDNLIH